MSVGGEVGVANNLVSLRHTHPQRRRLAGLRGQPRHHAQPPLASTTAAEPEAGHRAYWVARLNLPMDDPFWQHHHPGDHWNCKCSLEQNNDPVVRPADIPADPPQPGLDNNPGKDGHTFSDNHPYFPSGCTSCPFNKGVKNITRAAFRNEKKHCYQCDKINQTLPNNDKGNREKQYEALKKDKAYHNVQFNPQNTGLKATHTDHNFDKKKGWYETTVQDIGFENGHKVILEKENHSLLNCKNTEGTWDDMFFEIAAAETATPNNIRQALKHCAAKPGAEVAVIFFPNNNFERETFEKGLAKFNGLKGTSQHRLFQYIYCIDKEKIIITKKPR